MKTDVLIVRMGMSGAGPIELPVFAATGSLYLCGMTKQPASAEIRKAVPADESAILALASRLVAFGPPAWRDPEAMTEVDREYIRAALRADSDNPAIFVAVIDGTVAGFAHVHSLTDHYRRRDHAHLSDLVVAGAHEGKGIASLLIERTETWARRHGYDWMSLAVFSDNIRAERLYERMGFRRDTIRMIRPLD